MADPGILIATPINIPLERSLYIGNILRAILYGLEIFTFFAAAYCISHRPPDYRRGQRLYVIYGGILLMLSTISLAANSVWGQYMWIDHRNYPGGPLGVFETTQSAWYNVLRFAADIMANILGDGLLLYRCFIIWDSRWHYIALPVLIYLASSVLSIITVVESAMPGSSYLKGKVIHLALPWVSLSVSLNIIVTTMICFRLLRMRAVMRGVLDPAMSRMYTSIAAMLIESAAPFSILGIGFIVTAARDEPFVFAFAFVWSMFCVESKFPSVLTFSLSPQMIILRVAMGRAWRKETVSEMCTKPVFAQHAAVHEQSQEIRLAIYNTEKSTGISVHRMSTNESDTSV